MTTSDDLRTHPPFSVEPARKRRLFLAHQRALIDHHRRACPAYARILGALWGDGPAPERIEDVPYLPVGLFKTLDLVSVPSDEVVRVLRSSGTTGATPSRVHLDRSTAADQARASAAVFGHLLGPTRRPMLVVTDGVGGCGREMTAQDAAVSALGRHGRGVHHARSADGRIDRAAIEDYARATAGRPGLIAGLTAAVWTTLAADPGPSVDLSSSTVIHGGGWKRLASAGITKAQLAGALAERYGITAVHDYYGMVEQTGGVFLEDEDGLLCAPACTEVVVRDPSDWSVNPPEVPGVIQTLSILPTSYPGHSLLTEDWGVVRPRGPTSVWEGTRIEVLGRVAGADLRGCSDVA